MNQAQFDAVLAGNKTLARDGGGLCLHWEGKHVAVDYMERRIATIKDTSVLFHLAPELAHPQVAREMRHVSQLLGLDPRPEISASFQGGLKMKIKGDVLRPDQSYTVEIKR